MLPFLMTNLQYPMYITVITHYSPSITACLTGRYYHHKRSIMAEISAQISMPPIADYH